uniref:cytochrome c oxidase subunit III n=1 Tax=Cavelerius yunnanensis TaxID=2969358 RepID=UPI0020474B17|nr:cytochrome c oxidase subunit III [Cavelerius yunnanensis]UPL65538.1 cytochrome c oxidase subunit III [Cavelerius excavatus]UUJ37743.1 cytochrome c oxidase subunit 3 [Cavelerius yunnanensis]
MKINNHPFHLVDQSPWPITSSIGLMTMLTGMITWMHKNEMLLLNLGLMINIMSMFQWWRDIIRESTYQGKHTNKVIKGLKLGMILFITSEVFFFLSFFWSFFHSSLAPTIEIGMKWPPQSIKTFDPMGIPLMNTMILLCSGLSVTWAHHSLINNSLKETKKSLMMTIMLGVMFTFFQYYEYKESNFCISDSIYGSTFFMATGFHGIHVIIGTTFLMVCMLRHIKMHFSKNHHLGFEAAAWYWHFVDVVWIFLYISIYWWGS